MASSSFVYGSKRHRMYSYRHLTAFSISAPGIDWSKKSHIDRGPEVRHVFGFCVETMPYSSALLELNQPPKNARDY